MTQTDSSHAPKPLLLTINDTRIQLGGISAPTVYKMVKRGELKLVKIGARSLITVDSINKLAARE